MKQLRILSFLMLVLMMMPQVALGQDDNNAAKQYPIYCFVSVKAASSSLSEYRLWALVVTNKMFAHYICDAQNEPIYFQNTVDVFNYMSKLGWVYVEKVGNDYIFKKDAVSPDDAYKDLNALTMDEIKKARKAK